MFSEFAWKKNFALGNGEEGGDAGAPHPPPFFLQAWVPFSTGKVDIFKTKKKDGKISDLLCAVR